MNARVHRPGLAWLAVAGLWASTASLVQAQSPGPAPTAPATTSASTSTAAAEPEFVYRFRARDTLIQVSRRLLLQPQRWPEVQRRNGIRDPFNIPPDTPVRIPYSWLRLGTDSALVQAVSGSVTRDGQPVAQGDVLAQGTRLETGADGSVSLRFADGSVLTLQKSSVLRLQRLQRVEGVDDGHSAELQLDAGRAETEVQPKRDVGRFEIVTPVAVSAVRGTRFRTGFDAAAGHAITETLEGTVGVAGARDPASGATAVTAGFGTRVEPSGAVLPPVPLLPAPDLGGVPAVNAQPVLSLRLPPVPEAVSYRVQLAAEPEFRSVLQDLAASTPDFELTLPVDGAYWLRARAIDALGIEGTDATRPFTQHVLPAAPALISPASGARFYTGQATVEWAAPAAGQVPTRAYRLQLARDATFAELVSERTLELDTSNQGRRAELPELAPGTYYWRVAGVDARGELGAWSEPRELLQRQPPVSVTAAQVDRQALHLRWPAQPGESYRLQVARDAGYQKLLVDEMLSAGEYRLSRPSAGGYHARVQRLATGGEADPFGESRAFEVPLPTWLKVLLSSTVLLPLL